MRDQQYTQIWLDRMGQTGQIKSDSDVTIDCFPYGISAISDDTVDLIDELKPAYVTTVYWLTITILLALFGALSTCVAMGGGMHTRNFAAYTLGALLLPVIFFRFWGRKASEPVQKYIATRLFKLVSITADPLRLLFVLKKQAPIEIAWSDLEEIKLVAPMRGDKATVVFSGRAVPNPVSIPLTSLHTHENWIILSHAIASLAPHVKIDENIARSLTLQSVQTSFTELWLDSLSSPPEQASLDLIPAGTRLNNERYVVKDKLASGGQGHAYLALDTTTGEDVVVKTYLLPVYQGKKVRDSAVRELESESVVLQRIDHPQIVHFIDWFCESHRAHLVLNVIDGKSLRQFVKLHGALDAALAADLTRQMCDILAYLHSFDPPIVHRDFTPDNLIIDNRAKLTLIDFTVAEPTGAVSGLPPAGQPAYMPPEQFRGEACVQSDIYALGGTLQFLLTGDDPEALEQTDLRGANPSLPQALTDIVYRCRAQEPSDRYQTALAVREILDT